MILRRFHRLRPSTVLEGLREVKRKSIQIVIASTKNTKITIVVDGAYESHKKNEKIWLENDA